MSDLDVAKRRLQDVIKRATYLLDNIDIIHDCGYSGAGSNADSGRSARYHYYGDEVGDRRWRAVWRGLHGWLGLGRRGDRYTELVTLTVGIERLIAAGPPLTAEEYNALKAHEEKVGNSSN